MWCGIRFSRLRCVFLAKIRRALAHLGAWRATIKHSKTSIFPIMNIDVKIGTWTEQQAVAQAIRYAVFVIEQKIPAQLEWDENDAACLHAVAFDQEGHGLGTGRLLPDGHIGRMAVKKSSRSMGVGGAILDALVKAAQRRGDAVVILNAQASAEAFYARHGFARDGDIFVEAGIPHICMRRKLTA
jgi:predicted GNAT family N-acyltransferase